MLETFTTVNTVSHNLHVTLYYSLRLTLFACVYYFIISLQLSVHLWLSRTSLRYWLQACRTLVTNCPVAVLNFLIGNLQMLERMRAALNRKTELNVGCRLMDALAVLLWTWGRRLFKSSMCSTPSQCWNSETVTTISADGISIMSCLVTYKMH